MYCVYNKVFRKIIFVSHLRAHGAVRVLWLRHPTVDAFLRVKRVKMLILVPQENP